MHLHERYKHFDIHTQEPDWQFVAILNAVSSFGMFLAAMFPTSKYFGLLILISCPFWALGLAGTFHFLVTVPIMKKIFPRKASDNRKPEQCQKS